MIQLLVLEVRKAKELTLAVDHGGQQVIGVGGEGEGFFGCTREARACKVSYLTPWKELQKSGHLSFLSWMSWPVQWRRNREGREKFGIMNEIAYGIILVA
jgi:hypothetical protein